MASVQDHRPWRHDTGHRHAPRSASTTPVAIGDIGTDIHLVARLVLSADKSATKSVAKSTALVDQEPIIDEVDSQQRTTGCRPANGVHSVDDECEGVVESERQCDVHRILPIESELNRSFHCGYWKRVLWQQVKLP